MPNDTVKVCLSSNVLTDTAYDILSLFSNDTMLDVLLCTLLHIELDIVSISCCLENPPPIELRAFLEFPIYGPLYPHPGQKDFKNINLKQLIHRGLINTL